MHHILFVLMATALFSPLFSQGQSDPAMVPPIDSTITAPSANYGHALQSGDPDDADPVEKDTIGTVAAASPAYQEASVWVDHIGFGFDESGIACRYRPFKRQNGYEQRVIVTAGAMVDIVMPQNPYQQNLRTFHIKIGAAYDFILYPRMRIAAYGEFMEKMVERETGPLITKIQASRYPVWIYKVRAGVLLTLFSIERFMLTYRIGGEYAYFSPIYQLNETKTALKKIGTGTLRIGLAGAETSILEGLINNIGIYFYF